MLKAKFAIVRQCVTLLLVFTLTLPKAFWLPFLRDFFKNKIKFKIICIGKGRQDHWRSMPFMRCISFVEQQGEISSVFQRSLALNQPGAAPGQFSQEVSLQPLAAETSPYKLHAGVQIDWVREDAKFLILRSNIPTRLHLWCPECEALACTRPCMLWQDAVGSTC